MVLSLFYSRPFLLIVSFAFTSHYLYKFYQKKEKKTRKEIHDVIMFEYMEGKFRQSKHSRCKITHSMDKLLGYLDGAKKTLDICMYVLTNMDVANAVMKLHFRGVKVRVLIDADMAYTQGSMVRRLEKQGIQVRWMKSTRLMHHKFYLIDASTDDEQVTPVVMTGSLNWTNQALYGNWEDVIVTSQEVIVDQYKARFEKLWKEFKPVVAPDLKFY
ncbi:mitochondrial cardiolipin hydrolase-like [Ostrinia furnacalis]|uniref:mitochondrial cardiolipin hydrolase-like n=1 Tax=Ostrinia furnacalis TaxID=93504 RepID=UPI00103CE327|nr:mitochondrial cardiolipin hydrolase-like [Ostrinia furnacalis]